MKTSWLHATLLPLFLFSCIHSGKTCQSIEVQHVAVHDHASVLCPSFTAVEMTFMLHKGPKIIASVTYGNISNKKDYKHETDIEHYVNMTSKTTFFVLYNMTENKTDLYTCKAEQTYPPPKCQLKEQPQTIVIIKNHQCTQSVQRIYPLLVGLGVLIIYGLIITYIAISLKLRLRKKKLITHDYMNMKPQARRKKQGILHPVHHSWYRGMSTGAAAVTKPSTRQMAN